MKMPRGGGGGDRGAPTEKCTIMPVIVHFRGAAADPLHRPPTSRSPTSSASAGLCCATQHKGRPRQSSPRYYAARSTPGLNTGLRIIRAHDDWHAQKIDDDSIEHGAVG